MPTDEQHPCLTAALEYLGRGWSALPLCPHNHVGVGKAHRGCGSPGKRPFFPNMPDARTGEWKEFQTRRATVEEAESWWKAHPGLNVGIALGPVSGMVGIDVDDDDGEKLLFELSGGEIEPTWEYTTGKGRRLLFRLPDGVHVKTHQFTRPGTEIEILRFMSKGSQVVMPPSRHPNGSVYRWSSGRGPDDIPAAVVPEWLRSVPVQENTTYKPVDGELITEGGRNNYLTSLAGAMRKRGADEAAIYAALEVTNDSRFDPPLSVDEVRTVARSVARYEPDQFSGVTIKLPSANGEKTDKLPPMLIGERRFKWASELTGKDKADEWIWEGYLPKGAITLLSALWKAGKTTLLAHLLRALATNGKFLGQTIKASKVLYVSEEGEQHWVRRRDALELGDNTGFYLQPFGTKPDAGNWLGFIGQLKADVQTHGFDLVVFDTLAKLWPVVEENDAGSVDAALMPLWELTKAGAGVLLIHHLRKSGGNEYTGSRGSGALSAFPDIIMELTRHDAADSKSAKRVLKAKGRYDETPDELVIELVQGEYRHVPELASVAAEATVIVDESGNVTMRVPEAKSDEEKVLHVLKSTKGTPWLSADGIREGLKAFGWGIRDAKVSDILSSLAKRQQLLMTGTFRSKTNPMKYALAERVTSHSRPSALESVTGMTSGNEIEVEPESSHSQISFPLATQGGNDGNEMGNDRIWWPELLHMIEVNGPMNADRLHDLSGYSVTDIHTAMSHYQSAGFVVTDDSGTFSLKEKSHGE